MTLSYAFGGNTGQSYDALQRRRAYLEAAQKAGQSAPKTAGEGILNGLNSVFSDLMLRKLGKQEDANREAANQKALDLFGQPSQYGGGGASVPAYVPPDPNSPSQLGHDTMVALGKAPATPTKDEMSAYIAAKATELGIDPSVAVAVANSEGLNANPAEGWQSRVVKNGQREPSYGPFQLYMGGGLGNNFLEQTGLDPRDPTTWQKQVDFALGHAKNNGWGSWYGARNAGIGDFQGIGGQPQGASGIDPKIVAAMSDPNVSPEIKSALGVLLQQRIAAAQPPDPMDALELEKAKLEVDRLKNPGPPESVTTRLMLAKQAGLQPGTPEYSTYMATGELPKPQEPVKPIEINNKLVDPTTGKVIGDYGTPDPGFRMLTPEEAAAMRLPQGAYQVGPDNKVSQIGGGGTSVTVNNGSEVGTIPQGYELFTDPATGARSLRAIAGGPEDKSAAAATKVGNNQTLTDTIIGAANKARTAASNRQLGGFGQGVVAKLNSYSDSAEVQRQVDVLKANATVETLSAMRAASPTGGALGAVSNSENAMLAAKAGALDPSSPNFARDLDDYELTLLKIVHGPEAGQKIFEQTRGGKAYTPAQTAPTGAATTYRFNPATGKIEPVQ